MAIQQVTNEAMLDAALRSDLAVVFKHSTACGVSAAAMSQIRRFTESHPDVPVYVIDVRADRPLSQRAAERLGIRHESPQAIVIVAGSPAWDASHFEVTAERLEKAAGLG